MEEDGDALHGLAEEDEDIDQYNDDTFGAGAIDDDWQEEHERLAEMEEKLQGGREEERNSSMDFSLLGDENFAECISKLVVNSEGSELYDPAIMKAIHSRPPLQVGGSLVILSYTGSKFLHESPLLSLIKDVGLPKRPPLGREDERDLSECVLPPRSSSPIIGSPPVRTAPIGTPPKQPMMPPFNQQKILCPTPVHIRAPLQQRYPTPFNNSSLRGHPFPPSVNPVLTQLQRAQLMGTSQQTGRMSPSHFARVSGLVGGPLTQMNPKLMQGRMGQMMPAFRPFFGPHPHPPHPSQGHLQNMSPTCRSQQQMFRADTTHLHPQHRRLLSQRQQQNRKLGRGSNGTGSQEPSISPFSLLFTVDTFLIASIVLPAAHQRLISLLDFFFFFFFFFNNNYFEKLEKRPQPVDSNGDGPKKEHTKLITPQVAKLEHTYKPVQFEGSLGKLTVSSVNNPRKMIDAVVTTRTDDDETKEKQVRDKRRHTLYTIERTYSLLLDIQDFEKRFLQVPEEERGALLEQRRQKLLEMYESLRGKPSDDWPSDDLFVQVMCIRKGKHLVARALPYFTAEQAATIVMATARNLPFLIKKDVQDEVLPCLVKPCSLLISQLPPSALTGLLQQLTNLPHSTQSSNHIAALLQNKFGLTLLYVILSHGERLHSSNAALELMEDNRWMELVLGVARELLKIPQSSLTKPTFTPANLLSLFSRFVDRQSLNLLETKLQSERGML
uniref:Protein PAT1 homolog 1 n=1 Tax=Latimeria chalumnae TaxID=7897 RepID=H3A6F1_LATCH